MDWLETDKHIDKIREMTLWMNYYRLLYPDENFRFYSYRLRNSILARRYHVYFNIISQRGLRIIAWYLGQITGEEQEIDAFIAAVHRRLRGLQG